MERERAFWDAAASTLESAKGAIWGEPEPGAWEARVDACLEQITPALDIGLAAHKARKKARIMEIGCGIGRLALPVARLFPKATVVGVDISPRMLGLAANEAKAQGITNVEWILGDGVKLPDVGPIAAAWSMITFQHVPVDVAAGYIRQVVAALVPGGTFRFQFVEGDEANFLSHHAQRAAMVDACEIDGVATVQIDRGVIYPQWVFITATKR